MTEVEKIKDEQVWADKWEGLNRKMAQVMAKDPSQILWHNMTDNGLQFWVEKSLQYEHYELIPLLKEQIEKRKNGK